MLERKPGHQRVNLLERLSVLINSEVECSALTYIYIDFVDATDHHPAMWQLIGFPVLTSLAFGL